MRLQPPVAYQGGKGRIADEIMDAIEVPDGAVFCDLCCGSGAISLAFMEKGFSPDRIVMVDKAPTRSGCRFSTRRFPMPMAKKLFNEWWCKRAKDYRKDDDERRLWRAFCSGFYAAKGLDKTRVRPETAARMVSKSKTCRFDGRPC